MISKLNIIILFCTFTSKIVYPCLIMTRYDEFSKNFWFYFGGGRQGFREKMYNPQRQDFKKQLKTPENLIYKLKKKKKLGSFKK